ncbi:MAG: excinuclease ABC subunit UvrC [Bacteroidia bacterium]
MSIALQSKIRNLPDAPGVYRFLDANNKFIYIGKAKSLRKRVSSYFLKGPKHSYRIAKMVSLVEDIAYTVVNSEIEALLLENNLIKTHQPKYNILLKDGKTYPYICIKKERFPRVFSTRTKIDDGSTYYGPYPTVWVLHSLLDLIRGFLKLRNCNYHLSEANIKAEKFRRCLEYQIGNCAGPCEGLQSEEDYMQGIAQVRNILKGQLTPVVKQLEDLMQESAGKYEFEQAEYYRRRLEKLKLYKKKSTVVSATLGDLEVLTVESEKHLAVVNHFKISEGSIVQTHSWELKRSNQEEDAEILQATLEHMVADKKELANEIVSNVEIDPEAISREFSYTVPKIGDKKHLVDLSLKNSRTLLTEKLYKQNFQKRTTPNDRMMQELQQVLKLDSLPDHIECFDNSNFQGTQPVASCVVFKNGKAAKRDYRHFHIKTVEGPDDFASMKEIVYRRYKRLLDENESLPKLIVIDGGKGQVSSAAEALKELGLLNKIPMIGIAKRLEEIYRVGDPVPLYIDKKSPALILIQRIRNEAHRFAITFHRDQRSNDSRQRSFLTQIKGIGPSAEKEILREFRSVKKLKAASKGELIARLGERKAALILTAIKDGVL